MQRASETVAKHKFPHSKNKIIYSQTFFVGDIIHYILQCESKQTFIGILNQKYLLKLVVNIKEKISCICYCDKPNILFAGTVKGTIFVIDFKNKQTQQCGKIDAVDGQHILAMFSYFNEVQQGPELVALNVQGILRRYKNNKHEISINLPFKIVRALSNRAILNIKDIAMVFFKPNGKFPYILTAQYLILLMAVKKQKEEVQEMIKQQQNTIQSNTDQQFQIQAITAVNLSNTLRMLVYAIGNVVTVCMLKKQKKSIIAIPDFKFELEERVLSMDIIDSSLLISSGKGMMTYDIVKRKKIAKGLTIRGKQYDFVRWASLPNSIVYGSINQSKLYLCHLSLYNDDRSRSTIN